MFDMTYSYMRHDRFIGHTHPFTIYINPNGHTHVSVTYSCVYDSTATHWNTLQHTATHLSIYLHAHSHAHPYMCDSTATHCNTLRYTLIFFTCARPRSLICDLFTCVGQHCNTLQHTVIQCNTLQYIHLFIYTRTATLTHM